MLHLSTRRFCSDSRDQLSVLPGDPITDVVESTPRTKLEISGTSPPPRGQPCRGSRDNRQSATVSSITCFSGVPSADRVIRSLSLPPFTSPLRTRFSISRCDVTPTCFRNLRIAILKRSLSNSAVTAVLPDQAGKD